MTSANMSGPTPPPEDDLSSLDSMMPEQLVQALIEGLALTVIGLRRAVRAVKLLDEKGIDLAEHPDLKGQAKAIAFLRRIAHGQLNEELAMRFLGQWGALKLIQTLTVPEQRKLASDEPIAVAAFDEKGTFTHRMLAPSTMKYQQLRQVISDGRLHSVAEQRSDLEERMARQAPAPNASANGVIFQKDCVLINGPLRATRRDLAQWLARLT